MVSVSGYTGRLNGRRKYRKRRVGQVSMCRFMAEIHVTQQVRLFVAYSLPGLTWAVDHAVMEKAWVTSSSPSAVVEERGRSEVLCSRVGFSMMSLCAEAGEAVDPISKNEVP